MHWLPLTLLCALFLASADAAIKYWLHDYRARELVLIRFTLSGLLVSPLLLLEPLPELPVQFWYLIAMLLPLEILAMLLYMRAIRDHALSLTLPYLAFTPVFVTLTGWLLLGERVSSQGLAGILLVVAGAWVLNLGAEKFSDWRNLCRPLAAITRHPGSRLMLLVAALYSLTSVGGKKALQYLPAEQFGPLYFALVGLASLILVGLSRPAALGALWRRPGPSLLVAALMGAMVITHFLALQQVEVAYMIAVKRTSLLFGILYGALLFREQGLSLHLAGGGLMLGGVVLIAL